MQIAFNSMEVIMDNLSIAQGTFGYCLIGWAAT